jgi:ankyrin repeat protein
VDLLIARFGTGLDLNCRNSTGLTPLMKSAVQGRTRCAKSLLSSGNIYIFVSKEISDTKYNLFHLINNIDYISLFQELLQISGITVEG